MGGAEALAGAVNGGQHQAGVRGAVGALGRVEAAVAVAASADPLPEIIQQRDTAAGRRFAIAEQRVEPLVLAALALLSRVLVLDELPPLFVV